MTSLVQAEESNARVVGVAKTRQALYRLNLARIVIFALFLAVWHFVAATGLVSRAFISTPGDVGSALITQVTSQSLWSNLWTTLVEVFIAFVLAVVLGVITAVILDRLEWLENLVSPFLTAMNSMPRIALGPLFILWFGIGMTSKVVLAFSLGYFIILLSTLGALRNVDRDMLLMSRLYGAGQWEMFWDVRLPWALPGIFAGLKLTLIYSMSGAIIGEMIAAESGLGLLVQTYSGQFDIASLLAVLVVIVGLVMVLTSIIELFERRLLAWNRGSTDIPS